MKLTATVRNLAKRLARVISSLPNLVGARVDELLRRRPGLAAGLARYGLVVFAALGALFIVAGIAAPEGRGQKIVYASADGGIYAVSPEGGERTAIYDPEDSGFAAAPLLNGGSRSLSFTVFKGDGEDLRGDLYGADLVRGTTSLIQVAEPGEAFIYGGYSSDRTWLMAEHFSVERPPNVAVLASSGASQRYIGGEDGGESAVLGASWTAQNSLYAWLYGADGEKSGVASLTAYNFFERRQAVVYQTENRIGRVSYNFDSNTAVFDERPVGSELTESRLIPLAGTEKMPVSGADGLGVYDPSLPLPNLEYRMATLWTDGQRSGVGLFDPAKWSFEKTPVEVSEGSVHPQISYDGTYVATLGEDETTLSVRSMDDGRIVNRIENVQPTSAVIEKMRRAGMNVPVPAEWTAPPPYSWRSFAGS